MPRLDLEWEADCLARLRRGEREALAELYREFAPALYRRVLLPLLGEPAAAEDALAETFAAALDRLQGFEQRGSSIFAWLARIGRNKALDMHRRRQRRGRVLAGFASMLATGEPPSENAEQVLEWRQDLEARRRAVARVLGRLNPRYRKALEFRFLQNLPRQRCAELLRVKLGTFDVLLLRALKAFRREWERDEG